MRREFIVNILFLVGVNVIIKPLYIFGIDLQVQNTIGPSAYGLFAALFSLTYILQIVNDAGIQHFNNQAIASNRDLLKERYPLLSALKIWLGLLYFVVCALAAYWLGYGSEIWPLFFHIAVNHILLSWLLFLRSNVSGMGMYRRDSLLSISDKIWMILLAGIMLYHPTLREGFTLSWFVWAQTISLILTILLARFFLRGQGLKWEGWPAWKSLKPLLRRSLPYGLVVLLMTSYNRIDAVLIERLLPNGEMQAGIYYMAFRLLDVLNNFALLFGALLLPMFANMLSQNKDISDLVHLSTRLLLAGSIASAVAISRYAEEWIELLYKVPFLEAVAVLEILVWVFVPMCLMYVFSTLLTAGARLKVMNRVFAITVVLNLVLLFLLLPRMGIIGAAWSALVTQWFVALIVIGQSYRNMPLSMDWREWGRILGFMGACILILYLPIPNHTNWLFNFAVVLAGCFLLATVFGLLPMRAFIQLVRKRVTQ